MISSAKLDSEQCLVVAQLALDVPWASDSDKNKVMGALKPADVAETSEKRHRRSTQTYTAIHMYLADHMWEAMLDKTVTSDTKLTALLGHGIKLGLRCPSEPTLKWLCSLWLVCGHDFASLSRIGQVAKTMHLKTVKQQFDALRRRAPDPFSWIEKLPQSPLELLRDQPVTYKVAFPGQVAPVAPRIEVEMLLSFDNSYSCRGGLRTQVPFSCGSPTRPSAPTSSISSSSGGVNLETFLMGFMQHMQTNNMQMIQMLHPKATTSHAALEDRSGRHVLQLTDGRPDALRLKRRGVRALRVRRVVRLEPA